MPMRDAFRQLLGERPGSPLDFAPSSMASVFVPIDVLDIGPEVVVRANLPGVKAENVNVTYLDNTLTIKGHLEEENEFEGAAYLRHERRASTFSRSISLPLALDTENADAKLADGILTLRIPKSEKIRPKSIKINTTA
jgi:HSP20 family protein